MLARLFTTIALFALTSAAIAQQQLSIPRNDGAMVPLSVFTPAGDACPALAVISHGAGGTEKTMKYLAEGLRNEGWLVIVVGHKESGPAAFRTYVGKSGIQAGLLEMTTNTAAYQARFLDIGAAQLWAGQRCKPPFSALIGHSMGAATVMLEAGAKNKLGLTGLDRFDAYIAVSPQGPGSIFPTKAWSALRKPVLVLTGTRDDALEGGWKSRTAPYVDMPAGCKWLAIVDGATHLNFSGIGLSGRTEDATVRIAASFLGSLRKGGCGTPPSVEGVVMESK